MPASPETLVQVREVRERRVRLTLELITCAHGHELRDAVRPVRLCVEARVLARVRKAEERRAVRRPALVVDDAVQLMAVVRRLGEAALNAVLADAGDDRHLVVEAPAPAGVRQRIVTEQRRRLRTDAPARNRVAGKRQPGQWIEDRDRTARGSQRLREVPGTFERGRDDRRLGDRVVVRRPLIADEHVELIAEPRNAEWPLERAEELRVGVRREAPSAAPSASTAGRPTRSSRAAHRSHRCKATGGWEDWCRTIAPAQTASTRRC